MKARGWFKKFIFLIQETFSQFISDNALKLSASLSFYTIFSLPALLIIIISLCGLFFGEESVSGEIFIKLKGLVGNIAALQIQETIKLAALSGSNVFATMIGVILLLTGASGVFAEIQDSINYIWGIQTKPKRGLMKFIKNRLMSFSMIGSVAFLLLVSLFINSLMDIFDKQLLFYLPINTIYLVYIMNVMVVFIIITFLFVIIFKTLPDGNILYRDCFIGASFTAILFMIGKFAISVYLGSSAIASVYGTASSVIIILVWVYYSAIILYFGAEFTKVYAITFGGKILPNDYSIQIIRKNLRLKNKPKLYDRK